MADKSGLNKKSKSPTVITLGLDVPQFKNKRIYCVVANTVQAPLTENKVMNPVTKRAVSKLSYVPETKTTLQPAGRLMAQAAHVVSRTRDWMVKEIVMDNWEDIRKGATKGTSLSVGCMEPVTTINLGCRDSFELSHLYEDLKAAGIAVHGFFDTDQPDYGSADLRVRTAIATEPVLPEEVAGILDYLPLWKPNPWDFRE